MPYEHGDLPAIAIAVRAAEGWDTTDARLLVERSVIVEPVVHPALAGALDASATRRGMFTWSVGLGEDSDPSAIGIVLDMVRPGLVVTEERATRARGPAVLFGTYAYGAVLTGLFNGTPASRLVNNRHGRCAGRYPQAGQSPHCYGAVMLTVDGRAAYIKVVTHGLTPGHDDDRIGVEDGLAPCELNLRPAGRPRREPRPVHGAEAIALLDWAIASGFDIVDSDGIAARLRHDATKLVVAWPAHGRPAEASASVGRSVPAAIRKALGVTEIAAHRAAGLVIVTAADLASVSSRLGAERVLQHPLVADVAAIAGAGPVEDPRLRDYQRLVVARHVAARYGFVNALDPGMGKTITTLDAMRRRSETTPGWRGLVVLEANVRSQWTGEARTWFPEAHVVTVESGQDTQRLGDTLATAGDEPVLVLTSYALASRAVKAGGAGQLELIADARGTPLLFDPETLQTPTFTPAGDPLGTLLMSVRWDDLVADEAVGLRNTGSTVAAALWALRERSRTAVALTGTPIVRGLDDLGRLLAWTSGDRELFRGVRLSKNFDVSDPDGLAALGRALGPLVFRRDKSELADELPELRATVHTLTPTRAEKALADAARHELRRAYEDLCSWMEVAQRRDVDNHEYAEIRDALVAARGAWLGGTTLARMAASDPHAVAGSASAAAALLAGQGLVANACADGGTKRAWALEYCTKRVGEGHKVLVFTEFATVARNLIEGLTEAGLKVGAVLGGGGKARDRHIAAFRAGELDVLVSTEAGERGLNLQSASVIIHYDLPWTPDGVIQRTGRVERIGASSAEIEVAFPVMVGTIEDRVVGMVVGRAMLAMQVLDTSRGIAASQTQMGRALGGLADIVDESQLNSKEQSLLAVTRELLAA